MKRLVRITESELKHIITIILNEENNFDLSEYGRKGLWKPEWNEEDQILAMYNALYGIQELGINKIQAAHSIIGTSVDSLNQQTSNFTFLHTGKGLNRPHPLQTEVYEKYKNMPKSDFKSLCLEIIRKRTENPEESVTRKKLGDEIGGKRDEIAKSRENALRSIGIKNPERFKVVKSEPLDVPYENEPENEIENEPENEKTQIKDFLVSIVNRLRNIESKRDLEKLASDLEFAIEYIDNELIDKDSSSLVAEMKNIFQHI